MTTDTQRIAIPLLRIDIQTETDADRMSALAHGLGYELGEFVVIDPRREGPYTTVMQAIARTHAAAVIVPDLEHVDGIDRYIRERVQLINVENERVLERIDAGAAA